MWILNETSALLGFTTGVIWVCTTFFFLITTVAVLLDDVRVTAARDKLREQHKRTSVELSKSIKDLVNITSQFNQLQQNYDKLKIKQSKLDKDYNMLREKYDDARARYNKLRDEAIDHLDRIETELGALVDRIKTTSRI